MQPNWGDVPTWLAGIAAVAAVWVAYRQLSGLSDTVQANSETLRINAEVLQINNETLRMHGLMAILQIESELNTRKSDMNEVGTRLVMQCSRVASKQNKLLIEALTRQFKACQENYLNAVDRLAFCILKNYVPEKDWRAEYRDHLAKDIKTHAEFFTTGSDYRNILTLNDLWQSS